MKKTALVLVILLAVGAFWAIPTADLRSDALKMNGITGDALKKGKELLLETAEAHGLQRAKNYTTAEFTFKDEWNGLMGKVMNPWPENSVPIRMQTLLRTFTSRVEFLDGEKQGEVWGIQAWSPYKRQSRDAEVIFQKDGTIEFMLPTAQYFSELPFRIQEAEIIAYLGHRTLNGREYDLIFLTWGTPEANTKYDQYLVWIDRETSLIQKMTYTVRDKLRFMEATIHFFDYRDIQGVMIPFDQTTTLGRPEEIDYPIEGDFLHKVLLTDFRFESVDRMELLPDKSKLASGAKK